MKVRGLWGLEIEPQKVYDLAIDASFKITMASISQFNAADRTSVRIEFQGSRFLLCSLIPEKIEQQVIDLTCLEGERLRFQSEGPNGIHLMGNYISQGDSDDEKDEVELVPGVNGREEKEEPVIAKIEDIIHYVATIPTTGINTNEREIMDINEESEEEEVFNMPIIQNFLRSAFSKLKDQRQPDKISDTENDVVEEQNVDQAKNRIDDHNHGERRSGNAHTVLKEKMVARPIENENTVDSLEAAEVHNKHSTNEIVDYAEDGKVKSKSNKPTKRPEETEQRQKRKERKRQKKLEKKRLKEKMETKEKEDQDTEESNKKIEVGNETTDDTKSSAVSIDIPADEEPKPPIRRSKRKSKGFDKVPDITFSGKMKGPAPATPPFEEIKYEPPSKPAQPAGIRISLPTIKKSRATAKKPDPLKKKADINSTVENSAYGKKKAPTAKSSKVDSSLTPVDSKNDSQAEPKTTKRYPKRKLADEAARSLKKLAGEDAKMAAAVSRLKRAKKNSRSSRESS